MRLIDADALVKELSGKYIIVPADEAARGVADFMGIQIRQTINNAPTIETVPLEDYRSMEQTVHKLTQAIAEAEPRWIPTTERLPDVGVYVLVCTKQKSGQIIERIGVYSGTSYGWSTGGATREVVAWMPLPKAYKGDEVENG